MLKMLSMVFVVIISIIFLRKSYTLQQWIAFFVIIASMTLVSYNESITNEQSHTAMLGVILMVLSCAFAGAQSVLEEYLVKDGAHADFVLGWEGTWGLFFSACFLIGASTYPCDWASCPSRHFDSVWDFATQTK